MFFHCKYYFSIFFLWAIKHVTLLCLLWQKWFYLETEHEVNKICLNFFFLKSVILVLSLADMSRFGSHLHLCFNLPVQKTSKRHAEKKKHKHKVLTIWIPWWWTDAACCRNLQRSCVRTSGRLGMCSLAAVLWALCSCERRQKKHCQCVPAQAHSVWLNSVFLWELLLKLGLQN